MPGDILGWLDIVDRLDVPTLALLTAFGLFKLYRAMQQQHKELAESMKSQQSEFVGSLNAIERRLASDAVAMQSLADAFRGHLDHDRDDFKRVFDKIDDTRKEISDEIRKVVAVA